MNHQGLRWNVHCVWNVALRIRLNLYKRGFKIYDLLVFFFFVVLSATRRRPPLGRTKDRRESRNLLCFSPKAVETLIYADNVMDMYIVFFRSIHFFHVRFEGNNHSTPPLGRTKDSRESRDLRCLFAKSF